MKNGWDLLAPQTQKLRGAKIQKDASAGVCSSVFFILNTQTEACRASMGPQAACKSLFILPLVSPDVETRTGSRAELKVVLLDQESALQGGRQAQGQR